METFIGSFTVPESVYQQANITFRKYQLQSRIISFYQLCFNQPSSPAYASSGGKKYSITLVPVSYLGKPYGRNPCISGIPSASTFHGYLIIDRKVPLLPFDVCFFLSRNFDQLLTKSASVTKWEWKSSQPSVNVHTGITINVRIIYIQSFYDCSTTIG